MNEEKEIVDTVKELADLVSKMAKVQIACVATTICLTQNVVGQADPADVMRSLAGLSSALNEVCAGANEPD